MSNIPEQVTLVLVHGTTWLSIPGAVQSSTLHFLYRFLTPDPQVAVHLLKAPHSNAPWLWMVLALLLLRSLACCLLNTANACLRVSLLGFGRSGRTCNPIGNPVTGMLLLWFVILTTWVWIWYGRGALLLTWKVFPALSTSGGVESSTAGDLPLLNAFGFTWTFWLGLVVTASSATLKADSSWSLTSIGLKLWPKNTSKIVNSQFINQQTRYQIGFYTELLL